MIASKEKNNCKRWQSVITISSFTPSISLDIEQFVQTRILFRDFMDISIQPIVMSSFFPDSNTAILYQIEIVCMDLILIWKIGLKKEKLSRSPELLPLEQC